MQAFEYVTPTKKEQVATLLSEQAAILAGGTDLLALMKDDVVAPKRLVNIKQIDGLRGITLPAGQRPAHRRAGHHCRTCRRQPRSGSIIRCCPRRRSRRPVRRFATSQRSAATCASVRAAGTSATAWDCWPTTKDGKSMVVEGDNRYAAILGNDGPAYFVSPSTIAPVLIAYGAKIRIYSAKASGAACANCRWRSSLSFPPRRASASTISSLTRW